MLFKKKKSPDTEFIYYFTIFGKEKSFKAISFQKAIDAVMWQHFCGSSKGKVVFESSNDPNVTCEALSTVEHMGGFLNGYIRVSPQ